jgi:uncharacterized protein (DUF1800 family)
VETVLRSHEFYSDAAVGTRYAPPVSFVASNLRRLGLAHYTADDSVAPGVAAIWRRALGQHLLHPPGVGGWSGGRSWIGTGAMIDRARFAIQAADGSLLSRAGDSRKIWLTGVAEQLSSVEAQFD